MNFFDKKGGAIKSPIKNPMVEVGTEISLRSIDGQLFNCFTLVPVKKGGSNYVKCKYLLAVTDFQLVEMYPHPNKIGMAVTSHVHPLSALGKLRFKKGDPGVLILEFKSGKVSKLIMKDPETCVEFLKAKMKQVGIKGNLKPKSEKDIANAQACFQRAKEIEAQFSVQPSIEVVREMMDLLRRATEKFSEANDATYTEVNEYIGRFLARLDVSKLLDENSASGPGNSNGSENSGVAGGNNNMDDDDGDDDDDLASSMPPARLGSLSRASSSMIDTKGAFDSVVRGASGKGFNPAKVPGSPVAGGLRGAPGAGRGSMRRSASTSVAAGAGSSTDFLRMGSRNSAATGSGKSSVLPGIDLSDRVSRNPSIDSTGGFGITGSEFELGERARSSSADTMSDHNPSQSATATSSPAGQRTKERSLRVEAIRGASSLAAGSSDRGSAGSPDLTDTDVADTAAPTTALNQAETAKNTDTIEMQDSTTAAAAEEPQSTEEEATEPATDALPMEGSFYFRLPDEDEELSVLQKQALTFNLNEDDKLFDLLHGVSGQKFFEDEDDDTNSQAEEEAKRKQDALQNGDKELELMLTSMQDEFAQLLKSFKEAKTIEPGKLVKV